MFFSGSVSTNQFILAFPDPFFHVSVTGFISEVFLVKSLLSLFDCCFYKFYCS